jgi:hypothetical protein
MKLAGPKADLEQIERKYRRAERENYWFTTSDGSRYPDF